MKGTRPLDNQEIVLVSACFDGTFEARNRGLFMLGVSTDGWISELLSLTIGDVYQNGKLTTHSLRKSFAQRLYEESGDIYLVQELLGHRSVSTTQKSLGVNSDGTPIEIDPGHIACEAALTARLEQFLSTIPHTASFLHSIGTLHIHTRRPSHSI